MQTKEIYIDKPKPHRLDEYEVLTPDMQAKEKRVSLINNTAEVTITRKEDNKIVFYKDYSYNKISFS